MTNLIADVSLGTFKGIGTSALATGGTGIGTFSNFISSVIGVMTIVAIIWFIFTFITGAIGIISSGSDKGGLESARKKISTGIIGLVVVILATFIIDLIGYFLGFGSGGILNIVQLFSTIK